jgi:alpha/beta superfamily hydrolase
MKAIMGHRPFLVLADHLTRQGIAVLRYDDRGIGKSKGDFGAATHEDFVADALAAVAWLKTRPGDGSEAHRPHRPTARAGSSRPWPR